MYRLDQEFLFFISGMSKPVIRPFVILYKNGVKSTIVLHPCDFSSLTS